VQLVADPALGRGDCRVVTDSVQVDARMDTREACLARALLGDPR
jgi:flagellar assembly protein FliH